MSVEYKEVDCNHCNGTGNCDCPACYNSQGLDIDENKRWRKNMLGKIASSTRRNL